jgi:hypothetical protein
LKKQSHTVKKPAAPAILKGWREISTFMGEPLSVVHRWAAEGMPVKREGRFVVASSDELNKWMGQESGKPVHVATDTTDLSAELKRGLSYVRHNKSSFEEESGSPPSRKG